MILFIRLLRESVLFAYGSVIANKLRTFLTLLGITIGIFAIISVFTILDSMEANVRESISSLGQNVVRVEKWPWLFGPNYPWWEFIKRPEVNQEDFKEIKRRCTLADVVCFSANTSRPVKYGNNYIESVSIWMNSHEYWEMKSFDLESGRYFTPVESEYGRSCCILGNQVALQLFQTQNPIGKEIKLAGHKLTVIGVAKKAGSDIIGGGSIDEAMLIPLNFGRQLFDLDRTGPHIKVRARPDVPLTGLCDELTMIMRSVRKIKPLEKDNFALNQASVLTKMFDNIFGVIDLAGWVIGGFSILVGGFGIANIMFVSVKERTHIIGIQKACGAKKYVILVQFLFEAVFLSLAGGVIGLLFVFCGTLIAKLIGDFTIVLTVKNIIMGLTVSGIIGIVSGFAPAWTAARLNPVEAINTHF